MDPVILRAAVGLACGRLVGVAVADGVAVLDGAAVAEGLAVRDDSGVAEAATVGEGSGEAVSVGVGDDSGELAGSRVGVAFSANTSSVLVGKGVTCARPPAESQADRAMPMIINTAIMPVVICFIDNIA